MTTSGFTHESTHNESVEWYTPAWLFHAMDVHFDLDPASPGAEVVPWVPATRHLTSKDDGLAQPWSGRVWLNPPYGTKTAQWMRRAAEHGITGGEVVALVFARTDPAWFHESVRTASGVFFLNRRIQFVRADGTLGGSPGSGSMLVVWGRNLVSHLILRGFDNEHGSVFFSMPPRTP